MKQPSIWLKCRPVLSALALVSVLMPLMPRAIASAPQVSTDSTAPQTVSADRVARNAACPSALPQIVNSVLSRSYVAQKGWGVQVESIQNGTTLYSHNANRFFIPASNIKLLTSAAALESLGPQYRTQSRSLTAWVTEVNRWSNNGYADSLLRHIGGPNRVRQTLAPMGVDPKRYRQVDGSGLSRNNLATPDTFVNTLKMMDESEGWAIFYHSLPIAGISGTLRNRLKAPMVRGKVRAKTGTLWGVRALSGYLPHSAYGPIAFSILANQSSQPGSVLVRTIDDLVVSMARSRPCQPSTTPALW